MPSELRCQHKLHGVLIAPDILEVSCGSKLCGKAPGIVVLHRFNLSTGAVTTVLFSEPSTPTERL